MKRFIIAIAALGMITPLAAQAAPAAHKTAAVQTHAPAAQKVAAHKTAAHKTVKAKSTTVHKSSRQPVKKVAHSHAKK